jgi:alkanesulfonate monooxygenase SsuD/methylene tetrahydromethanopterin reductase-like flavin-dependent oxidoreductase (luciferase family)
LPPPIDDIDSFAAPHERAGADHALIYSFVGTREKVAVGIRDFLEQTEADELIVTGHIYDHQARLHSFEIAAELLKTFLSPSP